MILVWRAPLQIDFVTSAKPATPQTVPLIRQVIKCPKHFFNEHYFICKIGFIGHKFHKSFRRFFKSLEIRNKHIKLETKI